MIGKKAQAPEAVLTVGFMVLVFVSFGILVFLMSQYDAYPLPLELESYLVTHKILYCLAEIDIYTGDAAAIHSSAITQANFESCFPQTNQNPRMEIQFEFTDQTGSFQKVIKSSGYTDRKEFELNFPIRLQMDNELRNGRVHVTAEVNT